MTERAVNVLFLCTGNSARSIIAESVLRKDGGGRFNAFSAGTQPKGQVHPLAIEVLAAADYPTAGLRPKSWSEFAQPGAPAMDFIFTVCDSAAGESCPLWPGRPVTAHWGIRDPASVEGTELEQRRAFQAALHQLRNRISAFVNLPFTGLDQMALARRLAAIGDRDAAGKVWR